MSMDRENKREAERRERELEARIERRKAEARLPLSQAYPRLTLAGWLLLAAIILAGVAWALGHFLVNPAS